MLREGGGPRGEGGGEEGGAHSYHGRRVQVGEPISGVAEARLNGHQRLPVPLSRCRQQPRNNPPTPPQVVAVRDSKATVPAFPPQLPAYQHYSSTAATPLLLLGCDDGARQPMCRTLQAG